MGCSCWAVDARHGRVRRSDAGCVGSAGGRLVAVGVATLYEAAIPRLVGAIYVVVQDQRSASVTDSGRFS